MKEWDFASPKEHKIPVEQQFMEIYGLEEQFLLPSDNCFRRTENLFAARTK
jgi:hypothetical protein